MPDYHVIALLIVTFGVFWLYTRSWVRMEVASLLLLVSLLLLFYFFPFALGDRQITDGDIFQAFGHPALVAICSLMILARGLTMTGALEPVVRLLARVWRGSPLFGLLGTMLLAAAASGFVNDTPVLVLMLPMLQSLAERGGQSATRTLMPVNFAILAGGMLTSIGTSTNLLVLSIATDLGMKPMGLFDFTPIAALSLLVALPYLWLIAPRLLPKGGSRISPVQRLYAARILVKDEESPLLGRTLDELSQKLGHPLPAVAVHRDGQLLAPMDKLALAVGDELTLNATIQALRDVASTFQVSLYDSTSMAQFVENDSSRIDLELVEAVIGVDSDLVSRTLSLQQFAAEHGLAVVGVSRGTEDLRRAQIKPGSVRLAVGDMLLLQGPKDRVDALNNLPGLLVLGGRFQLPRSPKAPWARGIMAAVVLVAALNLLPIHVSAFLGVLAMILTGCVRLEGLGRALSLEVILLVASSIALGHALVQTGAADWIAGGVASAVAGIPPGAQLAAFMAFAALLTNFVSNSAAAAVGTPIAVAAATALGQPLEPYVLAVLFGANLSYATPMAYQTNLLVMSAAGYSFRDFVRVGLPLVVLMLVTLSWLLVRHYGL